MFIYWCDYLQSPLIPGLLLGRSPSRVSQEGGPISTEVPPEVETSHDTPFNAPFQTIRPTATSRAVPSQPHLPHHTPVPKERSYDGPGKKPAALFRPDPLKLEQSCRQAGGDAFAVDWIIPSFMHGVTIEALLRYLESKEIDEMVLGLTKRMMASSRNLVTATSVGCAEGKQTWWKNKDAPRHLRKFHFGLADVCKNWCVK